MMQGKMTKKCDLYHGVNLRYDAAYLGNMGYLAG